MTEREYTQIEQYMLTCMGDSAHDKEHIYRVLYNALEIAAAEDTVDYDVLITACMLHDVGRREQFENPKLCHAQVGAGKAYQFLLDHNYSETFAQKVQDCISTHRYRKGNEPQTLEAKILFDADKLDVSGAIGIARTLIYKGIVAEPLYTIDDMGEISDGTNDTKPSFFQEYKYKLENMYTRFYTRRAEELARTRQPAAVAYYQAILSEVQSSYQNGRKELGKHINKE